MPFDCDQSSTASFSPKTATKALPPLLCDLIAAVQALEASFVEEGSSQYEQNTASVPGEVLTMAGAVRQDVPVSSTDADGNRTPLKTDEQGSEPSEHNALA